MESLFHNALIYKDRNLLARARKLVPSTVHERATIRFRDLQITLKKMKKSNKGQVVVGSDKDEEEEVSLKDMELLELMDWFKNDFFSWVDSPDCEQCGSKTKFSHMCEDVNLMLYTDRVEVRITHHLLFIKVFLINLIFLSSLLKLHPLRLLLVRLLPLKLFLLKLHHLSVSSFIKLETL